MTAPWVDGALPEFPADDLVPDDELPTSGHVLRRPVRADGTVPAIEPFADGILPSSATPPAPDAFTADERFGAPPRADESALSLDPLSVEDSDPDVLDSDDPVTRRIPPSDDEERLTGELEVRHPDIPVAGHLTPTQERPPIESVVLEASETMKLDPPPSLSNSDLSVFEHPSPPDDFLFGQPERDTEVLSDARAAEASTRSNLGLWIALGLSMGGIGFALATGLLLLWLWLLAR